MLQCLKSNEVPGEHNTVQTYLFNEMSWLLNDDLWLLIGCTLAYCCSLIDLIDVLVAHRVMNIWLDVVMVAVQL